MARKLVLQLLIVMLVVLSSLAMPISSAYAEYEEGELFNRYLALQAAEENLHFPYMFPNDCTYYASTVLWAGGLPPSPEWTWNSTDRSQWASDVLAPGVTRTAAVADELVNYLVREGLATKTLITWSDNTAGGPDIGDLIAYDWDNGADGTMDHIAVVTGFTDEGYPLVSQHSPTQWNRYWSWSEGANNGKGGWIEFANPGSKAYLIRVDY